MDLLFVAASPALREIWKIPAAGGVASQLTHTGAFEAVPSPDGKLVYFTKQVHGPECAIWSVPAGGGPEKPVPELEEFNRISRGWGVTGDGIYFMSYEDSPQQTVRLLNFKTRQMTPLFTLEKQVQWGVPRTGSVARTDGMPWQCSWTMPSTTS